MVSFSRWSLVVGLVVVALGGGCSSDDKGGAAVGSTAAPGAAPTVAPGPFSFAITGSAVHPMAPKAPDFPNDLVASVKASLDTWLGAAVVGPLQTGAPSSGLDAVFTEPALVKISAPGAERSALLEEGTPLTGKVNQDRANASLTLLTAPGGEPVLVTAQVDVALSVASGDGFVDVVRSGELVLVPDRGTWRIDAFDLVTKRDTRAR